MMTREEKIYMIQLLLTDIRGNWADEVQTRLDIALSLCTSLNEPEFTTLANVITEWDGMDGRYFRDEFPYGYYGMYELHNLPHTLRDKSDEFKEYAKALTYPEYLFEDAQ